MSVTPELKKFVDDGDLVQIRCYLANYLIVDRTFALFDEGLAYASARLPVIQEHDGSTLEQDKSLWNMDYLNKQIVASFFNFSKERMDHIKEVVEYVVGKEEPAITTSSSSTPETSIGKSKGYGESTGLTGSHIIEEKEVNKQKVTPPHTEPAMKQSRPSDAGTTGRRVISETEKKKDQANEDSTPPARAGGVDVGTAMIVVGAALATVGVAVVKPIVIGAGVAVAGAGVVAKIADTKK